MAASSAHSQPPPLVRPQRIGQEYARSGVNGDTVTLGVLLHLTLQLFGHAGVHLHSRISFRHTLNVSTMLALPMRVGDPFMQVDGLGCRLPLHRRQRPAVREGMRNSRRALVRFPAMRALVDLRQDERGYRVDGLAVGEVIEVASGHRDGAMTKR